ncbi:facilitated trehalose transporter Tret1-like [Pollicipes pollicipes]|uniref:facilitated trehalose transporter Tret1-like n=1 Tax=Pollicipes pollicipes TaxID=41117 RepID=UPI001884F14A|nr:facilitated trehalose transporter Tret1-like [Pollicipes pollicipes]
MSVLLATLGASMAVGGWAVGIGVGGLCVDQLSRGIGGFVLTESQEVWIVTSNFIGTVVGSAAAGEFSRRLGAKNTMLWFCIPAVVGFVITSVANCYEVLLAGRLLVGFCAGPAFVLHVFYISSIASPEYRGLLAMLPDIIYMLYVIVSLVLGLALPWWWVSLVGAAVFAVPAMLALTLLAEAERSALFFGIELPTEPTDTAVVARKSPYSLVFLRELGTALDATLVSVLLCVVRIVTVAVVSVLLDRAGRRTLLIVSACGMVISYLAVAAYFYVPALAAYAWLPLAALVLAVFFFCMGVGSVSWCLIGEMVPPRLSDAAGAALVFYYNVASLLSVQLFPAMLAALGLGGVFLVHAGIVSALLLVVVLAVPETRGLSLQQIEALLGGRTKPLYPRQVRASSIRLGRSHARGSSRGYKRYQIRLKRAL